MTRICWPVVGARVRSPPCATVLKMRCRIPSIVPYRLSKGVTLVLALAALNAQGAAPSLQAQQVVAPDAGCVQNKGEYVCNWSSFKLAFERAHTVAVETGAMDRFTAHQVATLATELGKRQVGEEQAADLIMAVRPVEPSGINLGPADHELATLRVYAASQAGGQRTLLWAETLRGQGDRPWPAQVHALLAQFQERFPSR